MTMAVGGAVRVWRRDGVLVLLDHLGLHVLPGAPQPYCHALPTDYFLLLWLSLWLDRDRGG
jgi:hypothetical protein